MFRSLTSIFTSFFNQGVGTAKVQPEIITQCESQQSKSCQSMNSFLEPRKTRKISQELCTSPLAYGKTKKRHTEPSISRRDLIKCGFSGPVMDIAIQHANDLKALVERKIKKLKHLMSKENYLIEDENTLSRFASYKFVFFIYFDSVHTFSQNFFPDLAIMTILTKNCHQVKSEFML